MAFSGQYLTYLEYKGLGGTLAETPFNLLEYNARMKIDERTFGRLKDLTNQPQEVKLCVYKLIGTLEGYDDYTKKSKGGTVASENTDGYSVSYVGANTNISEAMNDEVKDIINTYLSNVLVDNVPVLYRGVE